MSAIAPTVTLLCSGHNVLVEIIVLIIVGAIIGGLARLVLPGSQNISMTVTIILGILGAIIGYYIAGLLGVACTSGIDWIRWIISVIVAAVLVVIYGMVTGRRQV